MLLMMTFSMTLSIVFLTMKHPLSMMMMIMAQTILVCLMSGMMLNSWWFSYMLFMVMIGGLLVLFMYMTNVASNEKFNNKNMLTILLFMMTTLVIMTLLKNEFMNLLQMSSWSNFNKPNMNIIIMKYYNLPFNTIMFLMMIYLLITMIMSVKITDMTKGALRQKY